jgi:hypothetical protein
MRVKLAGVLVASLIAGLVTGGAANAKESRGFAISLIYTASYTDKDQCPGGGNGGPAEAKQRVLLSMGYTKDQAIKIIANDDVDESGKRINFRDRGTLNGKPANVQNFPLSWPDPRLESAVGRFAYGFNLDGRLDTGSFEDPETGEKGVDNAMWRALGCFSNYMVRRPIIPYNESIVWDTAMDAMPAWLVSITGDDLSKDGPVVVRFDRALNVVMRDAKGGVLPGSSYTIDADPRSSNEFKAYVKNGVVNLEPGNFYMQGESQFYAVLRMSGMRGRIHLKDDGRIWMVLGGYQPWRDYYHYLAIRGEGDGLVDLPGVYNLFRKHADANPDPETGENLDISTAYYLEAVPVFHTSIQGHVVSRPHLPDTQGLAASTATNVAAR